MREVFARIEDGDLEALAEVLAGLSAGDRAALLPLLDGYTPPPVLPEPVPEPEPEPEAHPGVMVLRAHVGGPTIGGAAPRRLVATAMFAAPDAAQAADGARAPGEEVVLDEETVRQQERLRRNRGNIWFLRHEAEAVARRRNEQRHAAYSLAVIACVGAAADAVKRLHAPWTNDRPPHLAPDALPHLLRLRGADWCATLGRGMLRRSRSRTLATLWPFTEALLRAVGAPPPEEPAAVACYVRMRRDGQRLAGFLAADPWFDRMLPHLFDEVQVATAFADQSAWPEALLELAATGRVERGTVIAGCLRRLRAGGRPGILQPFLAMLKQLAPAAGELTGHRQELTGLLGAPLSTVADWAYTSLRALHDEAPLDPATLAEITAGMLSRPEKKLVRAHLGWLRQLPLDDLLDGLVTGLHHPVAELAGRTLDLIEPRLPHLPAAARDRLRDEVPALDGAVGQRLAALLGTAAPPPPPVPVLVAALPAEFPAPLDLGALAGELATVLRHGDEDPVRHELMLDGLVRAARGDRAAAARVLAAVMPQWAGTWADLIAAATGLTAPPPYESPFAHLYVTTLGTFVERRSIELAARLAADPPPALLATPATVAGHVDPDRVLSLLRQADRDGWQPGPADLTQALLRLPRTVDATVVEGAARLASPAGRRFADHLRTAAAEPRTWVEEVPGQAYHSGRRIAMLDAAGLPADVADPRTATQRVAAVYHQPRMALWPMVTPSHREVAAAHIQPYLVTPHGSPGTTFLEGLAAADGPSGPAMSLVLAYVFGSSRQEMRLAAADALITLAARPGWDSTTTGAEIGALSSDERIVLQRTVQPLTEAFKAGAHTAVWQATSAALPALLAAAPRPGLADLLTLAADARPAGARLDLPELHALAARPGRSRLAESARRLAALVGGR
ncbi:hypothetical protein [Dactylosporangium sp. NPDC006015]|uniref:hypothetical protein n=1 Tax=Dactylosporangium sp. NPDC006015 TaxID=3154576 RepID=UPI0033AC637F